jgi:hypothetical protein
VEIEAGIRVIVTGISQGAEGRNGEAAFNDRPGDL